MRAGLSIRLCRARREEEALWSLASQVVLKRVRQSIGVPEALLLGFDDKNKLVDPTLILKQITGFGRDRTRYCARMGRTTRAVPSYDVHTTRVCHTRCRLRPGLGPL